MLLNALVGTNPSQLQAALSIASAPGSLPFIIFGPPGTGKTVTMVEAIFQVLKANPSARILAQQLFRAYAPSRPKKDVPPELLDITCVNSHGHFTVLHNMDTEDYQAIVSTCVSASILSGIGMPRGHFSHIFIDEAGRATEPEAMVSIKGMADGSLARVQR
ncbi:hypothetical protein VKT23_007796 [Stygiomarasmius scandens]|uniref:Helicase/UvrB N-terminal domain-containing protein n=1 Tax=Marasmiellus scandens TaxID=2682957 RepID=A0ABR1JJC2_9AGAR